MKKDDKEILEWKAKEISGHFAQAYNICPEEALALFKQSRVYALMQDPKMGYLYEGNVALYHEFRWEYDDQHMTGEPVLDDNTPHKGMLEWMKSIYTKVKENDFQWKPLYPNNMPSNPLAGIYLDMFFKEGDHFQYVKFTIEYKSRCDENGFSHPDEGVKYYVLHLLEENNLEEMFEIPEPSEEYHPFEHTNADVLNDYGRFRYVFDDEETAKKVVSNELLQKIYPATYILTYEEERYWNLFVKSFEQWNLMTWTPKCASMSNRSTK